MTDKRVPLTTLGKLVCWILRPEIARDPYDEWKRFVARSRISLGIRGPIAALIEFNVKGGG